MGRSSSRDVARSSRSSGDRERHRRKQKKHKHHSKRRRSSSRSSDSSGETSDGTLNKKLELEREKRKEEKLRQKEAMKARETPEEKRARRLAKKLAKEQKRKVALGWDTDHMAYSNADNPFGDKELTETFVWEKKYRKEGTETIDRKELERRAKENLEQNRIELEKVRRQREEREAQKADFEMMQRDRENQQFAEWTKQEDQFHLQQAKLRSRSRIQDNRAKPIDLLARYIGSDDEEDELDIKMEVPYNYLNGLSMRDLEDLLEDIRVYKRLSAGENNDYWNDIAIIAEDELQNLKKFNAESMGFEGERRGGIHTSVQKEIAQLLKDKTNEELTLLEIEANAKVKNGAEGVDIGFWESLLAQLKAHMSRARLRQRHKETLLFKKFKLKQAQSAIEADAELEADVEKSPLVSHAIIADDNVPSTSAMKSESDQTPWDDLTEEERRDRAIGWYESGRYSPTYVSEELVPPGSEVIDAVEDRRRVEFAQTHCRVTGQATSQNDASFENEARKGMTNDEAVFAVEAPLEQKTYLWSDKYRPRKPRYFNRVHTGFEWNKYNQTHYDLDNPPPKIVQGYKFNIFYPDLLDPTKSPVFGINTCGDNQDFAILKFKAGPPYEDIGFKIVNREWEVSHRKGYRCQFQNGVFQLWFHFKKYRYRR